MDWLGMCRDTAIFVDSIIIQTFFILKAQFKPFGRMKQAKEA